MDSDTDSNLDTDLNTDLDQDNKIFKYKLKKKKMTNKINELIEKKKKKKQDIITKTLYKTQEFPHIINKLIIGDLDNSVINDYKKNIFIIVSGFECVGKSNFIEHLENYFGNFYTKSKINIKDKKDLNILDNFNRENEKKILYIETTYILIEEIQKKITDNQKFISNDENELHKNIYTLFVIPTNLKVYKSRLINKIFNLINSTGPNTFDPNTFDSNTFDPNSTNSSLENNFAGPIKKGLNIFPDKDFPENELLDLFIGLNNKYPLSDDDFSFLDNHIEISYNIILKYQLDSENIKIMW